MKKSASSVPEFPDDFKRYHFFERDSYALIGRFEEVRVALIGDTGIIDEYILCVPVGMPREEPVIVVTPQHNQRFIGGAAIVLACDAALLGAPPLYINRIRAGFFQKKVILPSDLRGEWRGGSLYHTGPE